MFLPHIPLLIDQSEPTHHSQQQSVHLVRAQDHASHTERPPALTGIPLDTLQLAVLPLHQLRTTNAAFLPLVLTSSLQTLTRILLSLSAKVNKYATILLV